MITYDIMFSDGRIAYGVASNIAAAAVRRIGSQPYRPKEVALADYADAESLAKFKPDEPTLTLSQQRALNRAMALELDRRGIDHVVVTLDWSAYERWRRGRKNTPALRAEFAARSGRPRRYRLGITLGGPARPGQPGGERAIGWVAVELADEVAESVTIKVDDLEQPETKEGV